MSMPRLSVRVFLFSIVSVLGLALVATAVTRLWNASTVYETSQVARRQALADKTILGALQAMRFERSFSADALTTTGETLEAARQKILSARAELNALMTALDEQGRQFDDPGIKATLNVVQSDYRGLTELRPVLDQAYAKAVDARDEALPVRWLAQADKTLKALDTLSHTLGDGIKQGAVDSRSLIDIKNAAWRTRATVGGAYAVLSLAVARNKPMTSAEVEAIALALGKAEANWGMVQAELRRPGIPNTIQQAYATAQASMFSAEPAAMRQSLRDGLASGKPAMSLGDLQKDNTVRQRTVLEVALKAMDEVVAVTDETSRKARFEMMEAVASIVGALIVALGGLAISQYRVIRPLAAMQGAMVRLSHNDVEVAIPGLTRRDEIGAMAASVQVFKDNLIRTRQLEEDTALARASAEEQRKAGTRQVADAFEAAVGGIVGLVSAAATELQATAEQMTSAATQTAVQSTSVAAAANQAAANVGTVAVAAEQLGASVLEIGRQVDGSAGLARSAVAEAEQTAGLVQELSGTVSKIGDVVGLISSIAAQTNLLALNATIEAARAGQAGRGFAVVAAEVKALADQTARATDEIGRQISQVQGATSQAVGAIGGIGARIREISAASVLIAAAVEQQGAATQEIVRNVAEASAGTSEVTNSITGVADAAEETGAAASQVLASASDLSRQSEHLSLEVDRFLATVRAA